MRKQKIITLTDRDHEMTFRITEMPASRFERWILRAGLLLVKTGIISADDLSDSADARKALATNLLRNGITALGRLDVDEAMPLLDELLECCEEQIGKQYIKMTPDIVDTKIQDFKTLLILRKEAFTLHVDFFGAESPSGSQSATQQATPQHKPKISPR